MYLIVASLCCMPETHLLDVNYASTKFLKIKKKCEEDVCFRIDLIAQICIEYLWQPSCTFTGLHGLGRFSKAVRALWSSGGSDICSCRLNIHMLLARLIARPRSSNLRPQNLSKANRAEIYTYGDNSISLMQAKRRSAHLNYKLLYVL